MAFAGPVGKVNMDISLRLQNKIQVFNATSNVLMNAKINICAVSSSLGLVFVGSNSPEIIVLCIKDIESGDPNPPVRRVPLPSPVTQIGTNCDGSIIAIDLQINGTPHIQLYSVPSFLTPNIQKLREFQVSTDNSCSIQICWNPVINTTLAVCTASGGLNLYSLKETGVEFHSIDPSLQAKCCCWSPKGKQIVAGFANGKLIQFNMELKSARIIECPPGIFSTTGNFEVIAVQWLSTYQFAVALSSQQEETRPVIHIVNAPKAGPQQYIAYDVCYSTSEVRPSRIYLQYIQQWGMILIASANCIDVSLLKISKPGDIPEWTQEFPNDLFVAELPLTADKEESFPLGFEIDLACQGRLLQEEGGQLPVMPMLHMLSTGGVLCSFYVTNTTPSFVDICSPPRPIDPRILAQFFKTSTLTAAPAVAVKKDETIVKTPIQANPPPFTHSTPSSVKTNLFGSMPASSTPAVQPQPPQNTFTGFSLPNNQASSQQTIPAPLQSTFQFASKPTTPAVSSQDSNIAQKQPLISVPPTFNPSQNQTRPSESVEKPKDASVDIEDERVYIKMIQDEMKAFELEFNFLMEKSKSMKVRIGTKEESAEMRRGLEELNELKKEATETIEFLRSDIQTHRLGLTEMFAMLYEAKAKCDQDNKGMMMNNKGQDRSMKRKLENLQKMVSLCDTQIQVVVQLLQSQWSKYQDAVTKKNKNRMHIPSLEGVYQTLTKQQEIIYRLSGKLKLIKSRLGICDDVKKQKNANLSSTIESLSDSIISMSLADQVQAERSKISEKKLNDLRNSLKGREVVEIRPQRPKLIGLNSEIVIEKRANALKSLMKKIEAPKPQHFTPPKSEVSIRPVNTNQPQTVAQSFHKIPSEPNFSTAQKTLFAAPAQVSQQPIQLTTKKPEETKPFSFASQPATSQPSFNLNTLNSQPSFSLSTSSTQPQQSFGLNTSNTPPSFSFSSTPLIINAEKDKKKAESIKVAPQPQKAEPKPPSNTPVAVSANFSLPIPPNKTPPKEVSVQETKSQPITSNETTSFTFSLPGKKETAAKPIFAAPQSSSDSAKGAFSFGASNPSESTFSFGNLASKSDPKTVVTTSASGFGSTPATTSSGSIFSGSGFSLTASDSNKPSSATTDNIFASKPEEPKIVVTTTSQPSIFSSLTSTTVADSKPSSSFSFASFGSSIAAAPSTQASVTSTTSSSIFASKTESPVVSVSQTKPADSIKSLLTGVNICSPDVAQKTDTTPPANIFGSSNFSISKSSTTTQSPFGSSSFGSALKSSTEVSSPSVTSIASSPLTTTAATPSIFGASSTQPSSGSLFGSLSLGGTNTDQSSTNIFGAKPEQSVFGVSSTPNVFGATPSNIFASANAALQPPSSPPTNIFGASPATTQTTGIFGQSSSIFNQATATPPTTTSSGSIFSQSNLSFPATTQSGSIFGQNTSIFGQPAATGTSIFSQNASPFGAPTSPAQSSGNIFGGNAAASPFGGSTGGTIFSGGAAGTGQATFGGSATFSTNFGAGGSIFGQQQAQPTFGGSATFGSPKSNIFSSPPQSPSSGNIFEQLGQQQGGNLFGNLAGNPQQQQQQQQPLPQQAGFQGSAFSSWR